ncbi:MAG: response regulator [Anaerolineae bacterium]|nr:response regulator [Anaerolineae bacterium]
MLLKQKRVFVVEDDPTNMAIIATVLKDAGALVIQDPWNYDTIERLVQSLPVDVILLDLMLRRGESGYDIFDKIKSRSELAPIPVVVVSASDPGVEMNKARDKGFKGYIAKPIRRAAFVQSIAAVLDGEPVWGGDFR